MSDETLRALAREAGISVEWDNYAGEPRTVAPDALRAVLEALGYACGSEAEIADSRNRLARPEGLTGLPPLVTAVVGRRTRLAIDEEVPRRARLLLETGGARDLTPQEALEGIDLPPIAEPGYHRLLLGDREIVLAVAPERAVTVADLAPNRAWGLAAQVYGLRHHGDHGIGDAAGIAALAEAAARRGADALALSPMHAMFPSQPERYGPYSPSSRLFFNPLHAAPALVFGENLVARATESLAPRRDLARLRDAALIDWPAAAAAKYAVLHALFAAFNDRPDGRLRADFAAFQLAGGELLAGHACFEALQAEQQALGGVADWREWPADLRDPSSPVVAAFRASRPHDVSFHMFLQWIADRSLAVAQQRAREAGMRIGLIADLAVGMDAAGSHAWSRPQDVLSGLAIGAPPDLFNPNGQQWGITSFSPRALAATGFAPFVATVRAALRNAGGVRIDHAMGLQRLWLVPQGESPADGAYLSYPLTDMLRLLALESHRHRAIVVGEDLGTVPEGFREKLVAHGVYGMRVLWFEKTGDAFSPPDAWDQAVAAMTSTHDLPTVAGWWTGADIALRTKHHVLGPTQNRANAEAERSTDRTALWQAFTASGVARGNPPARDHPQPFVDAALRFVARTASALTLLPLEDALASPDQPNLPGTIDEHPNWRRRLPVPASEVLDAEAPAQRLADVAAERAKS